MIVRLKQGRSHPDFRRGTDYVVLGIEADELRILGSSGRPYLYPRRLFEIVSERRPRDWVTTHGDDGEEYAYPLPLARPGFFEDFFDGRKTAVASFWSVVNERLSAPPARRASRRKAA